MIKKDRQFFVLAHNMRSAFNVGSVFRTSDCFAVNKIFLTGFTAIPPNSKIAKVALGAENILPWEHRKSPIRLISRLRKFYPDLQVVGLENNLDKNSLSGKALSLRDWTPKFPLLLILGEEVSGISKNLLKLCDYFLEIPQLGSKESLNVSVAFGVAAYVIRST